MITGTAIAARARRICARHAPARRAASLCSSSTAAGATLVTSTGAGPAMSALGTWSARGHAHAPAPRVGSSRRASPATAATPATSTGTPTAASARPSGGGGASMATPTCRICGRAASSWPWSSHGRCPMCQMYWRRHGSERPPQPPRPRRGGRPPAALRPCTHCGQLTLNPYRGLCKPCYYYWHRTGRERPPHLWPR
jgi:hypothetical protein